jgi:hypothetical protein
MHNENTPGGDTTDRLYDDLANAQQALHEKLQDAQTPGFVAEFDPAEAERLGAVAEDALSEDDALESTADLSNTATTG